MLPSYLGRHGFSRSSPLKQYTAEQHVQLGTNHEQYEGIFVKFWNKTKIDNQTSKNGLKRKAMAQGQWL